MTQLQSMTFNEIDFKLRCIAHFKKVHDKCVNDKAIQRQMLDQTVRADREIFNLINGDQKLNTKAGKLLDKMKLREFIQTAIEAMS